MLDRRRLLIANSQQGGVLPQGYTQLNYLESTGTQYINTGIANTYNTFEFYGDLQFTSTASRQFFGADNKDYFGIFNGSFVQCYYNVMRSPDVDRHIFDMLINRTNKTVRFSIDELIKDFTLDLFQGLPFYLFSVSGNNTARSMCHLKLFSTMIKGNDELLFNGIPALDTNNRPCMFDTVTQTPFYNIGTGEFLYG